MSETKPIYSGEAVLLNWHDAKSGRKIVLQLEKYAPGAHPFDGLDGERFGVVIVGPLAPAEHAEPVARKGKAGGVPTRKDGRAEADMSAEVIASAPRTNSKRRWQDMPASQRAALALQDPEFRSYVCGTAETIPCEVDADECLKARLAIGSKSDLDRNAQKAAAFDRMHGDFEAYRQARGHGVI